MKNRKKLSFVDPSVFCLESNFPYKSVSEGSSLLQIFSHSCINASVVAGGAALPLYVCVSVCIYMCVWRSSGSGKSTAPLKGQLCISLSPDTALRLWLRSLDLPSSLYSGASVDMGSR